MGDPCGVGPEILAKALAKNESLENCSLLVIGEPSALERASRLLGINLEIRVLEDLEDFRQASEENLPGGVALYAPCRIEEEDLEYGRPSGLTCRAVIRYIECAARLALKGVVDAVCTCPIHKANLNRHGFRFPGHTEFLRDLTGTRDVVMMLTGPRLRVALVTIHHAMAQVPRLLNKELIIQTISITGEALSRDFGIPVPRIAVAGLNPHAGEDGRFGTEESEFIRPAVDSFHGASCQVSGPFPPDTVYYRAYLGEFDAVVSMYHDQGLIPIKLVHFSEAVNVTLGMPIVRTSVDHGTAYDLAGTGRADEGSLVAAIDCAASIAINRRAFQGNLVPA
jgi:4-hydroxythreonine-4-phosphate dehydrogenase